ncbi:MAG: hypothetical protein U0441_14265 [Polyangiaceae bacterium]
MDRLVRLFPKIDFWLYLAFSIACVSYAAHTFYGYMHIQTGGEWSAPLDDVFIHFDYARATARGYPFQWTEGNGFSSGNTSLSYPFVLAIGYWVGFRGLLLMKWAAIVACASMLWFFVATARLFKPLGRWAKYLLPPAVLSVGALDWSLFSGMENAFHLAMWALALWATLDVIDAADEPEKMPRLAIGAGIANVMLYWTRPESAACVASFALFAALTVRAKWREKGTDARFPWTVFLAMSVPGALGFAAQTAANKVFTGEWSPAGAIAKLGLNHPYMTPSEKWDQYVDLLRYVVLRNTHHHFADFDAQHRIPWGWLVPIAALLPFLARRVRPVAALIWAQAIAWLLLVSLNGQVRWQNERYTMPAVAWLLVLAAMGLATLAKGAWRKSENVVAGPERKRIVVGALRVSGASAIAIVFAQAQAPRMRDQIWFFGRASRNIRDQHIVAGGILKHIEAERVLVGDAGALLYASDRPGIDLIGLGGYHDYPFARAGVQGLGATLELLERLPPEDRPDTMAIYPTWWGDLPVIFGRRITSVPVFGNVICGGSEKVIYKADWSPFDRTGSPRSLKAGEQVADEIDVADLMNEKDHAYVFPHPAGGFVDFRVLPDPKKPEEDLFDAGRVIAPGQRETMRVALPAGRRRLVMRTPPESRANIRVTLGDRDAGVLEIKGQDDATRAKGLPRGAWIETSFALPEGPAEQVTLSLLAEMGAFADFHVWIVATE